MKDEIVFTEAINLALHEAMESNEKVICFGLGVTDPKEIFGTTQGLVQKFGNHRVFDMPTSENGMTGIAIGSTLKGIVPVMVHQRTDFFFLALDQIINNASKWHYMFGGQSSIPITIRLIVGRGWGQGPTHSQNCHSLFAQIPGLKVVMPATTYDAKKLLYSSIIDPNPVIFIENRWLHNQKGRVAPVRSFENLGKAKVLQEGTDLTIVAMSYLSIEALRISRSLASQGVHCEVIDLRTVRPIDWELIAISVKKTGKLIVLEPGIGVVSVGSEIISHVCENYFQYLKAPPIKLSQPDCPVPTSYALNEQFYLNGKIIAQAIQKLIQQNLDLSFLNNENKGPHDTPGEWFKGPF